MVGEWELRNLDWINNFQVPLLVILYSNHMDILKEQLRRILNFLAVSVNEEKMECAMSRKEGMYRRQGEAKNGWATFS